jgi:hypothetical protein
MCKTSQVKPPGRTSILFYMTVSTVSFCLQIYPSLKDIPAISMFVYLYSLQFTVLKSSAELYAEFPRFAGYNSLPKRTHLLTGGRDQEEGWSSWKKTLNYQYLEVLVIRDILVRILIRILGSVPLTNRSGCGSGRPKIRTDPTDLDPDADSEHRYIYIVLQR